MTDLARLTNNVPKAIEALRETDLSLVEMAAVFRLAAETCTQGQVLQEIAVAIARSRTGPAR